MANKYTENGSRLTKSYESEKNEPSMLFGNSLPDPRHWNSPNFENSNKNKNRSWIQWSLENWQKDLGGQGNLLPNGNSQQDKHVHSNDPLKENSTKKEQHWDRGWAWMVAIAASICNFFAGGMGKGMGVMLTEVVERFQYPQAYSISLMLMMLFTLPCLILASYLTSRFKVRTLVMFGGMLMVASQLIAGFAPNLGVLYMGVTLTGIGGSLVLPPSYIIINQYFREKRSKGFALATLGAGIGGFTFAPIVGILFSYYGYTGAFMIIGALLGHIQIAGALMRPPPKTEDITSNTTDASREELEVDVIEDGGPEVPKHDETTPLVQKKLSRWQLLKNRTFALYLCNLAACLLPAVSAYIPALALELGLPTRSSTLILSISGLGDFIGRVISGFFFHHVRHGRKRMYHSLIGISIGAVVIGFGFVGSGDILALLAFIQGFLEAMFNAQRTTVPFEFVPVESMEKAVGVILLSEYVGGILGPVMHGAMASVFGTYAVGFMLAGSVCIFASIVTLSDFAWVQYHTGH